MPIKTDRNLAFSLRKQGNSYSEIYQVLGIPKSTLSGWFRNVKLRPKVQYILTENRLKHLQEARKRAVLWHNQQKLTRMKAAEKHALNILSEIDLSNKAILELTLAMLYLGEGDKKGRTGLGNSNPLILRFFISALIKIYDFDINKIKCELHLRADQNPTEIKEYWSKELAISLSNFTSVSLDKRTLGRPTYPTYKGVCILQCGNIALQRRLVYLSQRFCENIVNLRAVSSAGRASD